MLPNIPFDRLRAACFTLVCFAAGVLAVIFAVPVQAQTGGLAVTIMTPAEEETFYAGPSTWAYSINIKGAISGIKGDPTVVPVRLEMYQGSRLESTIETKPSADGSFIFAVTVNPEGSDPVMTVDMFTRHCTSTGIVNQCHYRTAYALPRGDVLLRVTAKIAGREASAERHITIDRSAYISMPVRVVLADHPDQTVVGVPVIGSTWLYMWRARSATGTTDSNGIAAVNNVEVLAQVPTHYVFRVEPAVVDGLLYESVESVNVTLPPGAKSAPAITLKVKKSSGQINGTLAGANLPNFPIRAIRLPEGATFSTFASASGTFAFPNLPVARYLVSAEPRAAADQGYAATAQPVDLTRSHSMSVTLGLHASPRGSGLTGAVRDAQGTLLPFAWVTVEQEGVLSAVEPSSGAYLLSGLPRRALTLVTFAPGYYNQAQVVDLSAVTAADLALTRRPETVRVPWGKGEIIVPPESHAVIQSDGIEFDYGWLWGSSNGTLTNDPAVTSHSLNVRLPEEIITVAAGKFAIEYLPARGRWLYVTDGVALVRAAQQDTPVMVRAGEMLNLEDALHLVPVPLDASVVTAIAPLDRSPVDGVWEATLAAQARDGLARLGIGVAQVTTLATYLLVVVAFVFAPLWVIIVCLRQHRRVS